MAKRRTFMAELLDGGRTLAMREAHAMSSAIRASEALIREYSLSTGEPFLGDRPERGPLAGKGDAYLRRWTGERSGAALRVEVFEVFS